MSDFKPLRGFGGAGVLEVVTNTLGNTFRTVYTLKLAGNVKQKMNSVSVTIRGKHHLTVCAPGAIWCSHQIVVDQAEEFTSR